MDDAAAAVQLEGWDKDSSETTKLVAAAIVLSLLMENGELELVLHVASWFLVAYVASCLVLQIRNVACVYCFKGIRLFRHK